MSTDDGVYADALAFDDLIVADSDDERAEMLAEIQRRIDNQRILDEHYGFATAPPPRPKDTGSSDKFGDFLRSKGRTGLPPESRVEQG